MILKKGEFSVATWQQWASKG